MEQIHVLDENTINQIAAGEVIERPASVVKELTENAIDAMATAITIEIKEGGISLIRITDNGAGIPKEDIPTAFLRHATSKIQTAEDLLSIGSLGFRGEALSSIAAVSMVELITKTKSSIMGCRYEITGGTPKNDIEDVGVPDGTTFIVRNLFFNTPARKKFLKSAMTEAGYISDIVERMALSHPEIAIRFINNGRHILNTSGNGNLKDVIYQIFGREITSNLLEVHFSAPNIQIEGFIGKPLISRGNRNFENYFINGRFIKSMIINKSIEEGYKNFMMQHKYPFTALQFQIEPELIDVNVHPSKMELRLRNADEIYPEIVKLIHETLEGKNLIVEVKAEEEKIPAPLKREVTKTPEIFETKRREKEKEPQIQTIQNTKLPENLKNTKSQEIQKEQQKPEILVSSPPILKEENAYRKPEQMTLFDDSFLSKDARTRTRIVGQVFETYWIVEYGEKMFIIDQHAAHEKVLFERTMKSLKAKENISQELNPPMILNLSLREGELVKKYHVEFARAGYEIEEFGGNDYAVHTVPYDLYKLAREDMLMEMIDTLADDGNIRGGSELIMERIASMSCKAAVKGNNRLSIREANTLIDELLTLDNPYHCPHGRPTIISMSKYELEKKFKRIV